VRQRPLLGLTAASEVLGMEARTDKLKVAEMVAGIAQFISV
jgi:hypothetical protein